MPVMLTRAELAAERAAYLVICRAAIQTSRSLKRAMREKKG